MAQQVFPTKSNLMATKRSLALATQGYDLMDRKRNILVREMMQLIDRAAGIQDRISAAYAEAYEALKKANIMLGSVGGYAAGVPVERGVQLSTRSVMGVELPTLKLNTTSPLGLYYDLESTNGTLDVAYLKFNEVKTLTVELAEVETSVIRLAEAIQKTQKRANALGNVQIPQMQKTIKSIDEVLSEREREEFSRLKVIKAQKRDPCGCTVGASIARPYFFAVEFSQSPRYFSKWRGQKNNGIIGLKAEIIGQKPIQ